MVVSFIFFIFIPKIGEDFQFDEHIFQMGWFNHQPVKLTADLHLKNGWLEDDPFLLGRGKAYFQG